MKRELDFLFDQLERTTVSVQEKESIKKVICTLLLKSDGETVYYLRAIDDPIRMLAFAQFFTPIAAQFKSQWVVDHMKLAIEKFEESEYYPEILDKLNVSNSFYSGIIVMPVNDFALNKVIGDIATIALDQDNTTIEQQLRSKREYYKGEMIVADAGLTYLSRRDFRGAWNQLYVRFRAFDALTEKYYGRDYYDWIEKEKDLYHAVFIGKTDQRTANTMFVLVSEFMARNTGSWFLSATGSAYSGKDISYLKSLFGDNMLPEDWYIIKPEVPADFDIVDKKN